MTASPVLRVLLVEDDLSEAGVVRAYLATSAVRTYEVTHFVTLRAAMRGAEEGAFDVVLLDLFLPDSQGLETLTAFRKSFPDIAMVVLTGSGDEGTALEALEFGAEDYVVKTELGAESLQRSLIRAVRWSERQSQEYREQLAQSESRSLVMIMHTELDGRFLMVPPAFCELLGYTERELLSMTYAEVTHPDDLEDSVAVDRQIVDGSDASLDIEKRYVRRDGRTVWVYLNSTIVTDDEGNPVHLRKYVRDITAERAVNVELLEREKEARKQAEAGRARLLSVFEQAPALMATTEGPEHVFTMANREYLEFFGGRDIIGKRVFDALPEIEAQGIIAILDDVYQTGESFTSKELPMDLDRLGTGNVERFYFNLVYQALRDSDGRIAGILANAVNITEQVQARIRAESLHAEMEDAYDHTIAGWARALDLRDEETAGHSQRVTDMTVAMAHRFGIGGEELEDVRRGALLHDIGKMAVPDAILLKPGPLTVEEWAVMKDHSKVGRDLLMPIAFLESASEIPYSHHEKWDGSGYPRGLRGEDIPLSARIFAVVDVYDALMSDRPYRSAWPRERVLAYLEEESASHFDPMVVDTFLEWMGDA